MLVFTAKAAKPRRFKMTYFEKICLGKFIEALCGLYNQDREGLRICLRQNHKNLVSLRLGGEIQSFLVLNY
ncbi:hypothetical protein CRP01_13605 [Flavilitoribacter nigricans DSM 23189 = NBRC 102662]|uniref:Uncharacterized protein n=1 Tax=Flavilitoribacter nigricans (strain ATCC 23147 / DSM 23189 / NBRC 102662 / NCIMB 1420 / SS-2) TaxID=1122177 RepID=A0A2D0NCA1_FLAN2|nr:hypothetical protein CRP01_13605 [Flavilitoribacter nigricans DSM 23189 = NBRC 102662]